jgi:hypothetical protein
MNYMKNIARLPFLTIFILDFNKVSPGLGKVPNQTYIYLSARNIGNDEPINSATFTLISGPAITTASSEVLNDPTWVKSKPVEFNANSFGADLSQKYTSTPLKQVQLTDQNSFRQKKRMILLK